MELLKTLLSKISWTTLGGRRFILCLGCGAVTSLLVWHAKISDAVYRDIIVATIAVYVAGNTTQKIKSK